MDIAGGGGREVPARLREGAVALTVAVVLAVGVVACGGSDDDAGRTEAADAPGAADAGAGGVDAGDAGADDAGAAGRDESPREIAVGEIGATFGAFIDFVEWEAGAGACDRMTDSFKRRIGAGGSPRACARRVGRILSSDEASKGKRELLDVRVRGDRATATVRNRAGVTHRVGFARRDDRWKVDSGRPWR